MQSGPAHPLSHAQLGHSGVEVQTPCAHWVPGRPVSRESHVHEEQPRLSVAGDDRSTSTAVFTFWFALGFAWLTGRPRRTE